MAHAGDRLVAGRIPGERIATIAIVTDSAAFTTTQVSVGAIVAPLIAGQTYLLRAVTKWESDTQDDRIIARLREDTVSGTIMQSDNIRIQVTSTIGWGAMLEAPYTATVTGNKTFHLTGQRGGGSGTCFLGAAATRPVLLYVNYTQG
jgi:hypothetical protein